MSNMKNVYGITVWYKIIAETISKSLLWNMWMCFERIQSIVYESDAQ